MLMATVRFDKNSPMWVEDARCNIQRLLGIEKYINAIIRRRGYIYLNKIYDLLGVDWNPENINRCIKCDSVDRLAFVTFELFETGENAFDIVITSYEPKEREGV